MTDQKLLEIGPADVSVITPEQWEAALDFEKVIITGTDLLSVRAMSELAKKSPVVAVHHKQTRSPARANLIDSASTLICRSPRHLEIELEWTSPASSSWVTAPLDISEFGTSNPKENFALWAARLHDQKGPSEALSWSTKEEIPLLMLHNKPRGVVLEAMSRAKYFVFLPNGFDAEPRSIIEAVLSGCEVVTNDLAGITSIPDWRNPETLQQLVQNSGDRFWELALQ
jgi:hypothetical protein